MHTKILLTIILSFTILSGCVYPTTTVKSTDRRPKISVQGAQTGAVLYVDGLSMGQAIQYDGVKTALMVEPGKHIIEIRKNNNVLYSQTIFLGHDQSKLIKLR